MSIFGNGRSDRRAQLDTFLSRLSSEAEDAEQAERFEGRGIALSINASAIQGLVTRSRNGELLSFQDQTAKISLTMHTPTERR